MKELSIEEKAKRYDEALRVLHKYDGAHIMFTQDLKEEMFPELKSEDEGIRKALISHFCGIRDNCGKDWYGFNINDIIAWLEKQGEQTSDKIVEKARTEKQRILLTETDGSANIDWDCRSLDDVKILLKCGLEFIRTIEADKQILTDNRFGGCSFRVPTRYDKDIKQGEQKPIIEMKSPEESLRISSKEYNEIVNECLYGEQKPADKVEPKFKVGDFIADYYCKGRIVALTDDAYLLDTGQGIPFSCEHNAHLWTIQDAKNGDVLVDSLGNICIYQEPSTKLMYHSYCYENHMCFINMGGSHEITGSYPATKEQRNILKKAMSYAGYTFDFEMKELKKIEQKPAVCSEEDEHWRQKAIDFMKHPDLIKATPTLAKDTINWLKSLKDRYTWKPSDEQIRELSIVATGKGWFSKEILSELLEQLKKLKGEIKL